MDSDLYSRIAALEAEVAELKEKGAKEYLTPKEVSERFGLAVGTLANWRSRRVGPPFVKAGGSVLYHVDELHGWLDRHRQRCRTIDPLQ